MPTTRVRLFTAALLGTASLFATLPAFAAEDAGDVAALKAQIEALSKRINELETKQKAAAAKPAEAPVKTAAAAATPTNPANPGEGKPVVGGSMPGSFKLPGSETSVKFGGYAKLDAIEDVGGAYGAQYANFANIPLSNNGAARQGSQFNMHARQSRLNMETRTPSAAGEVKTFLEVDFFGSARGNANTTNGEGLQLRQAYGQVGHVLAGQTWSNFMDMDAYPESLDYIGPSGLTFVRRAQIGFTDSLTPKLGYAVAVVSPDSDLTGGVGTDVSLSRAPDLTAKLQYKDSFGQLSLRGLARELRVGNNSTAAGAEDTAFGWGVGLSGKINSIGKDAAFFQGVYGDGVGHYLFDVANSSNGSTYVGNKVRPQEAWGGYVGYQHYWSQDWRSNIMAGYSGIDNDVAYTGVNVNKEIMSQHLNLIWQPNAGPYRVGLEYMHGYRAQESGYDGDLDRIQTTLMYSF